MRDPCEGVNVKLGEYLMKFVPKLNGVLLGWWDLRLKDVSGGIMWEFSDIHISVGIFFLSIF